MNIEEIIENIDNGIKLHVKFREFFILFEKYYVGIYPFAYLAFEYPTYPLHYKDYNSISIYRKEFGEIKNPEELIHYYHHVDYTNNKLKYDPCIIYEKISGRKIHHGEDDEENVYDKSLMVKWHEKYDNDFKCFQNYCFNLHREQKLKRILQCKNI